MSLLFSATTIGSLPLTNRIVIAPMCQYSAIDGSATDWHMIHLGHLALSGAGLLIMEATAVTPDGRISPADLGLWSDENEESLARVLHAIRAYSPIRVGIQLSHAGRKASTSIPWEGRSVVPPGKGGWQTVAASAIPFNTDDPTPLALDEIGIQRVRDAFTASTQRAQNLGIDTIEIHAAHGYLLHQFLSPLSNHRTDMYGGSLEQRMRFPLEIYDAVRSTFPSQKPVGVRISATDWVEGGWDLEQSIVFVRELEKRGCAYIHVSSGGLSTDQRIPTEIDYQIRLAEQIRRVVNIPVIAVGLITEAQQAENIIASEQADMIALARAMLYDPRWPWHAAAELGASVNAPPQYWRCQPREYKNLFIQYEL